MVAPVDAFGDASERVTEELFFPLGVIGQDRVGALQEMETAREYFSAGREDEALGRLERVVGLVPGNVRFRIEFAGYLKQRGQRLFRGGRRKEGAVLLEKASYQAQSALERCSGDVTRGREAADCYLLLGDLSFDVGRDAQSAAGLYRSAVGADTQNGIARERLVDALQVLDRRGERRATGSELR